MPNARQSRRGCNGEPASAGSPCQDAGYYPAHLAICGKLPFLVGLTGMRGWSRGFASALLVFVEHRRDFRFGGELAAIRFLEAGTHASDPTFPPCEFVRGWFLRMSAIVDHRDYRTESTEISPVPLWARGRIMISTSWSSAVRKPISFSTEKPSSRKFASADTFG